VGRGITIMKTAATTDAITAASRWLCPKAALTAFLTSAISDPRHPATAADAAARFFSSIMYTWAMRPAMAS